MKPFLLPSIAVVLCALLLLSGCTWLEKGKNAAADVQEAYDNTQEWVGEKTEQTEQAIDDVQKATAEVQEAGESVDQALNSDKTVTGTTTTSENQ